MKFFTKEVKIGLAGVIALFLLIYGINYLKGIDMFKPSSYMYVSFKNVNGLAKSSPVFADGYKVGLVRDIGYDFNQSGNVIVEVELETDLRIPKGSSGELVPELMGGVQMNILLANNPRESYAVGDTIPGVLKSGMTDEMGKMLPEVSKLIPKLDSILTSVNLLLSHPALNNTLIAVEKSSQNLELATGEFNKLMKNDIPQLTAKMNVIGDNFVKISDSLAELDIQQTYSKIDNAVSNISSLTDRLSQKDNTLGLFLNDSTLYNRLTETGDNAAKLLEDIKLNPKRYVHFSVFGKKNK
ncbi:MlaD family protein [Bacteroides propionicifaciens]|jgi:phospholipid/cholesterol/gamma-HCH transport system substrate-binding protein|uniref:MlaD family protein n=1 Tax=Bacteroides propionicifaciens TaxID=392838 RepID=UPI00038226E8|nr:MlaD family protein [Bacteroides propionicifaciens]